MLLPTVRATNSASVTRPAPKSRAISTLVRKFNAVVSSEAMPIRVADRGKLAPRVTVPATPLSPADSTDHQPDEFRVADQVSPPEPAWLLQDTEQPFDAGLLRPARRAPDLAGEHVEAA